jgi:protein-S-isoprenylcysteine O-methyltransferase Ste14
MIDSPGTARDWPARAAYGALFALVLPAFLVLLGARVVMPVEAPRAPVAGLMLAGAGLALLAAGVWGLWRRGHGLPMNAFPPPDLVTTGAYAVVPHPIYVGFCLACAGVALAKGSAAGLYVATPVAALGCLALAVGHERRSLLHRFGRLPRPLLGPGRLRPAARVLRLDRAWRALLDATERLANAWASARLGRLRVMNHVVFSGLAGGVGAAIIVLAAGEAYSGWVAGLMLAGAVGAALIGQLLVGSCGRLSRPFGYFGGLLAIGALGGVVWLVWPPTSVVLAAFCLAAPWAQAIGRLRCLVQGCCHGGAAPAASGIVVTNTHSRVCGMAGLGGRPIYPTQLYSILGNLALGPLLLAGWVAGVPQTLIMGGYLVGAGAIRFVEEAYRGEPLTRIVRGLRIYQWLAVGMHVTGLFVMLVPAPATPPLTWDAAGAAAAIGAVFVVVCGAAMSIDAPESRTRFSRLSG